MCDRGPSINDVVIYYGEGVKIEELTNVSTYMEEGRVKKSRKNENVICG